MSGTVDIRINHNKTLCSPPQSIDLSVTFDKSELCAVTDKSVLTSLILSKGHLTGIDPSKISYVRKSKKHKGYIPLESRDDFRGLARSLKVKNVVRLRLNDATTYESEPSSGNEELPEQPMDFGKIANALVEAAIEQFKEIVHELSNSHVRLQINEQYHDQEPRAVHESASCDRCSPTAYKPIIGVRYRCLICRDFDLCGDCEALVQKLKERVGNHEYGHTMAKIVTPEGRFDVPANANEAEVLDISLDNYGPADKTIIQNFLASAESREVMSEYLTILDESKKYNELRDLLTSEKEDDSDLSHAKLLSLLDRAISLTTDKPKDESSNEVVFEKKEFASNSSLLSVSLSNSSNVPIGGGELEFRFSSGYKLKESHYVNQTPPILPGRKRRFNLPSLPASFKDPSDIQLQIFADGVKILECPFKLDDISSFELQPENKLASESPTESLEASKEEFQEYLVAKIYPLSSGMASLHILNKTEEVLSCDQLNFKVNNCFDKTICDVTTNKLHGLKQGRMAKFNIPLNSGHMKYPFKLIVTNGDIEASWDMYSKKLEGRFYVSKVEASDVRDSFTALKLVDNDKDSHHGSTSDSISTSEVILPSLSKDSMSHSKLSSSEYEDAASAMITTGPELHPGELSDYDIISVDGDAEEEEEEEEEDAAASDFEVLSTVTSQQ